MANRLSQSTATNGGSNDRSPAPTRPMSNLKSNCLPENIRRRMATETRRELKAPTSAEAQAKIDAKREKELQENIAALLRQRNIWFARQRMDKRATGTVGQPDFLCAVNGRPLAMEAKAFHGCIS